MELHEIHTYTLNEGPFSMLLHCFCVQHPALMLQPPPTEDKKVLNALLAFQRFLPTKAKQILSSIYHRVWDYYHMEELLVMLGGTVLIV